MPTWGFCELTAKDSVYVAEWSSCIVRSGISSIFTVDSQASTQVVLPCSFLGGFDLALGAPLDFALAFEVVVGVEEDVELEPFC